MDNLIKKYEYDMQRHEKRFAKMKQLESEGKHYDIDDIALSDDEKGDFIERLAEARLREKKDYEDEPYKVAQDEEKAVEKQYEEIKSKLEALKGKVDDGEKLKPDD
jgi:phage shock protein A